MITPYRLLLGACSALSALFSSRLPAQSNYATPYAFTTLAGAAGTSGFADGAAASARFSSPQGIAVGATGNVYVSDTGNYRIRKITSAGIVSTLAGSGSSGTGDGPPQNASFGFPTGLAVDGSDSVYVADTWSYTLRIVSSTGYVTTYAGAAGMGGYLDGPLQQARFSGLGGVAVDRNRGVYIADTYNNAIRKFTVFVDAVTTLAGIGNAGSGWVDATGTAARFMLPYGIAVDSSGIIYVADTYNNAIRRISANGIVTTLAGRGVVQGAGEYGYADGSGSAARFNGPRSLATDSAGNVYVADTGNNLIRKITPAGLVTTLGGSAGIAGAQNGTGAAARFDYPSAIAVDSADNIYIADSNNHVIRKGSLVSLPAITQQPVAASVAIGRNAIFSVAGTGGGLTYQWRRNGVALTGNSTAQTNSLLVPNASPADAGSYDCVLTNLAGSITTTAVALTVGPPSALANISTRAYCATGDNVTIGGFVIAGSGTKRVLIRAVGPSLTTQGIGSAEALADPTIEIHDAIRGNSIIGTNDNWIDNPNAADITATASTVGASALLASDTKSAALLSTLSPGVYTFVVTGKNGSSGIVLLEVYDADTGTSTAVFTNISSRAYATTGNGIAIGGFVIGGNGWKNVLIRAVGASLPTMTAGSIAAAQALADPSIELYVSQNGVSHFYVTNQDWTSDAYNIGAAGARVGAVPFAGTDTTSSALYLTLAPGVYSFIAQGRAPNPNGIVLVELYDAD